MPAKPEDLMRFNDITLQVENTYNGNTGFLIEFTIELQYARGSEKRYHTVVEVDLTTVMSKNSERKELRFALVAPDLINVEESAINDEVAYFREQTQEMPRLLTLVDY